MSSDKRDLPRAGSSREGAAKPDTRDCAQQGADGDIHWKATERNYPNRGGLDGSR